LSRIDADTIDGLTLVPRRSERPPRPGALVLFGAGVPILRPLPGEGARVHIQRDTLAAVQLEDGRVSRRHAECVWEGDGWRVRDLDSRNGTSVDGEPCVGEVRTGSSALVRVGDILVWLVPDVGIHEAHPVHVDRRVVIGATFGAVLTQVAQAAEGRVLHLTGPSGAGKEVAARWFHERSAVAKGPFVAINCAAIPEGVAERVLFGAKKGSYSGAHADAVGHLQEADGGTLFLDEVGELDLHVQGKLLRALEAREIIPLGASLPSPIDVRFCSATHRDLRQSVAEKTFREDLYFRIGRPAVSIPPLRARREEIPVLVHREVSSLGVEADASLIEACLLRPWPGNVRELLVEVGVAARAAAAAGDRRARASDLGPHAGLALAAGREEEGSSPPARPSRPSTSRKKLPEDEVIEAALLRHEGKVASAARDLGVHRNQLRRWLAARGARSPAPAPEGG
jgi:transcriptional regulator of acetoin/glycerol metabolism